ncbi:MAG TPA: zf-HC2 domain-containing protein [Phycisphaerae bacterium]|nr:zf-HC2 domain-containing protein [Phycisphaerae bacterium]
MGAVDREDQLGELLGAYLDGELSPEERAQVERLLQQDATARQLLRDLERTAQAVGALPRHPAPPSLVQDIERQLERLELLGDIEEAAPVRGSKRGTLRGVLAVAAMLVIVAGGTLIVARLGPFGPGGRDAQVAMTTAEEGPSAGQAPTTRSSFAARPRGKSTPERLADAGSARRETAGKGKRDGTASAPESYGADVRTLAQKLDAGEPLATAVRTHSFATEPLRLKVSVGSEAERESLLQRLAMYCGDRNLPDLGRQLKQTPVATAEPGSFYLWGEAGTHFTDAGAREVLVHAPAAELADLVAQFERTPVAMRAATFQAGALELADWRDAEPILRLMDKSRPALPAPAARPVLAEAAPQPASDLGLLGDFAEAMQSLLTAGALPAETAAAERLADAAQSEATRASSESAAAPGSPGTPDGERKTAAAENDQDDSLVKKRMAAARRARTASGQPTSPSAATEAQVPPAAAATTPTAKDAAGPEPTTPRAADSTAPDAARPTTPDAAVPTALDAAVPITPPQPETPLRSVTLVIEITVARPATTPPPPAAGRNPT